MLTDCHTLIRGDRKAYIYFYLQLVYLKIGDFEQSNPKSYNSNGKTQQIRHRFTMK